MIDHFTEQTEDMLFKALTATLNEAEKEEFKQWLKVPGNREKYIQFSSAKTIAENCEIMSRHDLKQSWRRLQQRIHAKRQRNRMRWTAASVAAVLALSGGYFYFSHSNLGTSVETIATIEPTRSAFIRLADGRTIDLRHAAQERTTLDSIGFSTNGEGSLSYTGMQTSNQQPEFNEIQTPALCEYQLTLPDGTHVWLNSHSKLRFPTAFRGKKRVVYASGDLYFDVKHDAQHPFQVVMDDYQVEVLGTVFNVCNYAGKPQSATLISGSIQFSSSLTGQSVRLKPNQQALANGTIQVREVNVESLTAWMKGYFLFDNQSLVQIMEVLAQWYDVKVEYANNSLRSERFSLEIKRQTDLQSVLNMLETSGNLHFSFNNNTITIK